MDASYQILPIVAFLIVVIFAKGKSHLDALRVAFGGLAILAAISLASVLWVARRDIEILVPAMMRLQNFLAIPVFFGIIARTPGRRVIVFALLVGAIIAVAEVLGIAGALFLGATIAESGRRAGAGDVVMPLVSAAAYAAIAVKAFFSAREALNDWDATFERRRA
jgi:hypothetical protein